MEEERIKSYFEEQMHLMIERSAAEADGFLAYFAAQEPKDEEILGLLAISTGSDEFPLRERFPTPLEALAALSASSRSEICRQFRKQLKGRGQVTGDRGRVNCEV